VQASAALRYSVVWWHVLNQQTDGNLRSGPSVGLSEYCDCSTCPTCTVRRGDERMFRVDLAGSKVLLLTAVGLGVVRRNQDEPFFVYPLIIIIFSVPWSRVSVSFSAHFQIIFFRCIVLLVPSWFHRFPLPQNNNKKEKKYTFLSLDLSSRRVTVTLLVPDADSDSGNGDCVWVQLSIGRRPATCMGGRARTS
jgi:hypothetical protein